MKNSSHSIPLKRKRNSEVPTDVNSLTDHSIPSKRPRIDLPFQAYVEEAAMIAKAEPQFTDWPFNKDSDYDKDCYDYDDNGKLDDAGINNDASLGEPNGDIPINCGPSSPVDATFREIVNNSPRLSANNDRPCGENGWTLNGDYNWSNGSYRCPQAQILDRETPSVVLPHAPVEIITCGLVPFKSTANSSQPAFKFYMPSDLHPSVSPTSVLSVRSSKPPKLLKRRKNKTSMTKLACVNNHYTKRAVGERSSSCSRDLGTLSLIGRTARAASSPSADASSLPICQTSTSIGSTVPSFHNGNLISAVTSRPTHVPVSRNDLNPKMSVLQDAQAPGIKLRIKVSNGSVSSAGDNCSRGTTGFQEHSSASHVHSPSHVHSCTDRPSIVRKLSPEDVIAAVSAVVPSTAISCHASTGYEQREGSDITTVIPSAPHSGKNSRHSSTAHICFTGVPQVDQTQQCVKVRSQLTAITGEDRCEATTPAVQNPDPNGDLPQLFPSTGAPSLTTASIERVISNAPGPTFSPSPDTFQLPLDVSNGHHLLRALTNSASTTPVSVTTKKSLSPGRPRHPEENAVILEDVISGIDKTISIRDHDMRHNGVTRCVSSNLGPHTSSTPASNVSVNDTEQSDNEKQCINNEAMPGALHNGSSDGVRGKKRKLSAGGVTQAGDFGRTGPGAQTTSTPASNVSENDIEHSGNENRSTNTEAMSAALDNVSSDEMRGKKRKLWAGGVTQTGDVGLYEIEVTRDNSAEMDDNVCVTVGSGNENRCTNNEAMSVALANGSSDGVRGKKRKLSAGGVTQAGDFGLCEIEVTRDNHANDSVSKDGRDNRTGGPSFEDGNIFQRLKCIVK